MWGERKKLLVDDLVLSLKGGRGGEGPARSARSLVLDVSDGSLVNPVVGRWWGGSVSGSNDWLLLFLLFLILLDSLESRVEVDEFLFGQIGEDGQSVLGSRIRLGELLNFVQVLNENQ